MMGDFMKKYLYIVIFFNFLLVSSCSTYNSIVPRWMEIGSDESKEVINENPEKLNEIMRKKAELEKLENEIEMLENETGSGSSWWNPLSWFN